MRGMIINTHIHTDSQVMHGAQGRVMGRTRPRTSVMVEVEILEPTGYEPQPGSIVDIQVLTPNPFLGRTQEPKEPERPKTAWDRVGEDL